jgi:hypothetical protein
MLCLFVTDQMLGIAKRLYLEIIIEPGNAFDFFVRAVVKYRHV